jgi:2-polyprenyl-3-methyl-5-hydroxy-6-metoxy-1,4-benzoquinol methylase
MSKILQSENWSKRKQAMFQRIETSAKDRARWINTNLYYHKRDAAYLNFILSKDCSVLDIGCGNGWLLGQLNAKVKCGVDLSPEMVHIAKETCPEATVIQADIEASSDLKKIRDQGPFDYIILS